MKAQQKIICTISILFHKRVFFTGIYLEIFLIFPGVAKGLCAACHKVACFGTGLLRSVSIDQAFLMLAAL